MNGDTATTQWQARAACRGEDPELFFPLPAEDAKRARAKAICARCPVTVECMATANHQREKYGVWAGFERTDKGRPKLPHGPMPKGGYRIGRTTP